MPLRRGKLQDGHKDGTEWSRKSDPCSWLQQKASDHDSQSQAGLGSNRKGLFPDSWGLTKPPGPAKKNVPECVCVGGGGASETLGRCKY